VTGIRVIRNSIKFSKRLVAMLKRMKNLRLLKVS